MCLLHLQKHRIQITDEILIWEGEGENRKLKLKTRGHIVNQALIGIVDLMAVNILSGTADVPSRTWGTNGTIRVGTGVGATTPATVALVADSGVAPSSVTGTTSNPAVGSYRVEWKATWNAGSLLAITVTEFGLKLNLYNALYAFGATPPGAATVNTFASRISSTDGDFVAFVVVPANDLVIQWRWTFTFV